MGQPLNPSTPSHEKAFSLACIMVLKAPFETVECGLHMPYSLIATEWAEGVYILDDRPQVQLSGYVQSMAYMLFVIIDVFIAKNIKKQKGE